MISPDSKDALRRTIPMIAVLSLAPVLWGSCAFAGSLKVQLPSIQGTWRIVETTTELREKPSYFQSGFSLPAGAAELSLEDGQALCYITPKRDASETEIKGLTGIPRLVCVIVEGSSRPSGSVWDAIMSLTSVEAIIVRGDCGSGSPGKFSSNISVFCSINCSPGSAPILACLAGLASLEVVSIGTQLSSVSDENSIEFHKYQLGAEASALLGKLRKLRHLRINHISLPRGSLRVSVQVTSLELAGCALFEDCFEEIAAINALRSLSVADSDLSGSGVGALTALKELSDLTLTGENLNPELVVRAASELANLQSLTLIHFRKLRGEHFSWFKESNKLKHLALISCVGLQDDVLGKLAGLPLLESLGFRGSKEITSDGIKALQHLKYLKQLDFAYCSSLSDTALSEIVKLSTVEEIDLSCISSITLGGIEHLLKGGSIKRIVVVGCDQLGREKLRQLESSKAGLTIVSD